MISHRLPAAATLMVLMIAPLARAADDPPRSLAPRPVRVQTVTLTRDHATLTYSGSVRARVLVDLGFRVGGKVVERPVNIADRITAGQVLARLDPTDRRLAVEAAESVAAAAAAEAANAREMFARYEQLGRNSAAYVPTEFDRRRAAMLAADAHLVQAQQQVSMARSQMGYDTLRAEADGIVTALPIELGQVVAAGQTAVSLAHTAETEIVVDVPENRLEEVRAAESIDIALWAAPGQVLHGSLREVGAVADPVSRTFAVKISVTDAPRGLLGLGMTATVRFISPRGAPRAVLPAGALAGSRGEPAVWVLNEAAQRVSRRTVDVIGYGGDGSVIIGGGLRGGEKVVTAGAELLDREMAVTGWTGPLR